MARLVEWEEDGSFGKYFSAYQPKDLSIDR
jgi:hypothetical protein